jgi:hypothetical protein
VILAGALALVGCGGDELPRNDLGEADAPWAFALMGPEATAMDLGPEGELLAAGALDGEPYTFRGDGEDTGAAGVTLDPAGGDAFLAVYDPDHSLRFAITLPSAPPLAAFDASGEIWLVGDYDEALLLEGTGGTLGLDAPPSPAWYLARLSPEGEPRLLQQALLAPDGEVTPAQLEALPGGGVALAAGFRGETVVLAEQERFTAAGADAGGSAGLCEGGCEDLLLARFGPDGAVSNTLQLGGEGPERAARLLALHDSSLLLAGEFSGSWTLGEGDEARALTSLAPCCEQTDGFLLSLGPDLSFRWVDQHGWTDDTRAVDLIQAPGGRVYAAYGYGGEALRLGVGQRWESEVYALDDGLAPVALLRYDPGGALESITNGLPVDALAADESGRLIAVGVWDQALIFGNEQQLFAPKDPTAFVAWYEGDGEFLRMREAAWTWVGVAPRVQRAIAAGDRVVLSGWLPSEEGGAATGMIVGVEY